MIELNFITPYSSLTDEHVESLKTSVSLGYATEGSIEALKHCEVVSIYIKEDEPLDRLIGIFSKQGYSLLEEFDTSTLIKH